MVKPESDKNNLLYVRVDKTRKINAHVLMRAMGLSDNDVVDKLRHPEFYQTQLNTNDEGINSEDRLYLNSIRSYALVNHLLFPDNNYYIVDSSIQKDMI